MWAVVIAALVAAVVAVAGEERRPLRSWAAAVGEVPPLDTRTLRAPVVAAWRRHTDHLAHHEAALRRALTAGARTSLPAAAPPEVGSFAGLVQRRLSFAETARDALTAAVTELIAALEAGVRPSVSGGAGRREVGGVYEEPPCAYSSGGCTAEDYMAAEGTADSAAAMRHDPRWPLCAPFAEESGAVAATYSTMPDLLGHLARDAALNHDGPARRTADRLAGIIADEVGAQVRAGPGRAVDVLVPGTGTAAFQRLLARRLYSVPGPASGDGSSPVDGTGSVVVVGTECSGALLAATAGAGHMAEATGGAGWRLHPWASAFDNALRGDHTDQFQPHTFWAAEAGEAVPSYVLANDVFGDPRDAAPLPVAAVVVTHFVVDAVAGQQDLLVVLRRLDALVAPGGLWVNHGPLKYHDPALAPALTAEEVVAFFTDELGYAVVVPMATTEPAPYSRAGPIFRELYEPVLFALRKPSAA